MDTVTEVEHRTWSQRIFGSIFGALFGLLLIPAACALLWWNEGNSVRTYKSLVEAAGLVVSIPASKIDPTNESRLVHVVGKSAVLDTLRDDDFGLKKYSLKLTRDQEMFQWVERTRTREEKKLGGGTKKTTTYEYELQWHEGHVDSSRFEHPSGHENPRPEFTARRWQAQDPRLEAFSLTASQLGKLPTGERITLTEEALGALPPGLRGRTQLHQGGLYIGRANPGAPNLGDLKISYRMLRPTVLTVVARQTARTFAPYQTKAGKPISLIAVGERTWRQMFDSEHTKNLVTTWVLRFLGWLMMMVGLSMILEPLGVIADFLPFFGNLLRSAAGLFAFLVASIGSLVVVAAAWFAHRPLLSLGLIGGALALVYLGSCLGKKAD